MQWENFTFESSKSDKFSSVHLHDIEKVFQTLSGLYWK